MGAFPVATRAAVVLERVEGIEPSWPAWKAGTLPLCYTRDKKEHYLLTDNSANVKRETSPARIFHADRDEETEKADGYCVSFELLLGQHQCSGEPGVDCRNR